MSSTNVSPARPRAAEGWRPRSRREQRIVFGRMYEDPAIEEQVFPAGGEVLCIASAGDTALALAAAGWQVTAVDANPAQVAYAQDRVHGAPPRPGSVERLLGVGRLLLAGAGWTAAERAAFCALDDPAEQVRRWRERSETLRFRTVTGTVLSRAGTRAGGFGAFTASTGKRFDEVMKDRIETGLGRHPNRSNPYAQRLFGGAIDESPVRVDPAAVTVRQADVAEFLEGVQPGRFAGFSLSNVLDATGPEYTARLRAAVRRAAAPGAIAVWRSFAPTTDQALAAAALEDRSLFWGSLEIAEAGRG